jgi:hypothetical protein
MLNFKNLKIMKSFKILFASLLVLSFASCTSSFDDINKNPNAIVTSEASARYFLTVPQYKLYAPDNYPYWRAQLIHADRFAGYFCFGDNYSWWDDGLAYSYHPDYTDATWDFYDGYFGQLDNFLKLTQTGGEFENKYMNAVGLIMKGLYFQMYTETFGEIPYTQTGKADIALPAYDEQKTIYKGIIAELNAAMATIGTATKTGEGVQDIGTNDVYCKGDLQKWKKLANTLKLRIAMRANGVAGDDFSATAISEAFASPLLSSFDDNVLMEKDNVITKWNSDSYAGAWLDFGGFGSGGGWGVSKVLVDYLRDYSDPRLNKYVKPALGGTFEFVKPASGSDRDLWPKRVTYLCNVLTNAGADYTKTGNEATDEKVIITMAANKNYLGHPTRLNGFIKPLIRREFFCTPTDFIVAAKGSGKIYPEIVMTSSESYFLKAEAIVKGLSGASGDANAIFQEGIRQAMLMWGVDDGGITTYLSNAALANISTGTTAQKLEKIAVQRWIASYTEGFEGWAIVRKSGYPAELANGVSDVDIFALGDINGQYPERMIYGNSAKSKNGANLNIAIGRQGADKMETKLWFSK